MHKKPSKEESRTQARGMAKSIEDYATIEAYCEGAPVYAFGYTYVYSVSPDLQPSVRLQKGNAKGFTKIKPKKSWEIKNNKLGSTPGREPKTMKNDWRPFLCIHLIDGDPGTVWCSRGYPQPTVRPEWIRLDLPVESRVKSVVLVPHKEGWASGAKWTPNPDTQPGGQGIPKDLTIKVSWDGWHWDTVFESKDFVPPEDWSPMEFTFEPRPVKQVWIIGDDFPYVLGACHAFSLAGVKVIDENGDDVALASRGTGVTVSSTNTSFGMDRFTQDMLWPIQYDLGYKWLRVGYAMGMYPWPFVEQEKGKYEVDRRADEAITEAVSNGMNVIMCLIGGNWLYAPKPRKKDRTREFLDEGDVPPPPTTSPEMMEGWLRYVRYMVRHFKERVRYFEIWNEWNQEEGQGKIYAELAKPTIQVIREEYPEAKISAVGVGSFHEDSGRRFIKAYLEEGLGPHIDVIAWHPWYQPDVEWAEFLNYADEVRRIKKECESYGFKGEYMATEWDWRDAYPPKRPWDGKSIVDTKPMGRWEEKHITELMKAKYAAQITFKHVGLEMVSLWNETFQTMIVDWACGLNRITFDADPIPPTQLEAIYYIQRTLSTLLDDVKPAEIEVEFSNRPARLELWTFTRGNGERLVAFWIPGQARDKSVEIETDVVLKGIKCDKAVGVDIINGREQELHVERQGDNTILKGMLIQDFPVCMKF